MFGTVGNFIVNDFSAIGSFIKFLKCESFKLYKKHSGGKKAIRFLILSIIGLVLTHFTHHYSDSICVTTLTYILLFDIFSVIISIMALWIEQNPCKDDNFFGYQRYEVLAVFTSTVISQISALFAIKEAIERLFIPSPVDFNHLGIVAIGVLILHIIITFGIENKALSRVIETSSSSWLQEHITDISEGLCHFIPSLSSLLLPRINPVNLLGIISACVVFSVNVLMQYDFSSNTDNIGAIINSILIIATMTPLTVLSAKILLQTCPGHLVPQIDKALRSASTFDGVLEIQKEHFWSLGFHNVAGSVHVRVRRDANEQLVLAHVANKLMPLVQKLTIQVFKDNWTRASASVNLNFTKVARSNPFISDFPSNLPDVVSTVAVK